MLIDLSHTVEDGQTVYPHLPAVRICDHLTRAASREHYTGDTTFHIGRLETIGNVGTWVDAPFHRFADGADLSAVSLDRLADLEVCAIRVPGARAIDADAFAGRELRGRAVLFATGWSTRWQTPGYLDGFPFLTAAAAGGLVERGAAFVGIDSLNVDDPTDGGRPVHTALLRAGIPIGENLAHLDRLPDGPVRFHAVPVKLRRMGSFPVRAYAIA